MSSSSSSSSSSSCRGGSGKGADLRRVVFFVAEARVVIFVAEARVVIFVAEARVVIFVAEARGVFFVAEARVVIFVAEARDVFFVAEVRFFAEARFATEGEATGLADSSACARAAFNSFLLSFWSDCSSSLRFGVDGIRKGRTELRSQAGDKKYWYE
jgi:hypothetical protein